MLPNKKKISTGGYSLIFHPAIDREGKEIDDLNYVSKIQVPSISSENEIIISKKIRTIKNYNYHFSPVISHTTISLSTIHTIIQNNHHDDDEFKNIQKILCGENDIPCDECIHMMIPYVGHNEYHEHISKILYALFLIHNHRECKQTDSKNWFYDRYIQYGIEQLYDKNSITEEFMISHPLKELTNDFIILLMDGFCHLVDSISILLENNIVHNDIKDQNILYDQDKCEPILIDFGLSLTLENIKDINSYKDFFFVYKPSYTIWNPDIHFINFLIHQNEQPTLQDIEDFVFTYIEHAKKYITPYFTIEQIQTYTNNLVEYYSSFYTENKQPFVSHLFHFCNKKDVKIKCDIDKNIIIQRIIQNYKKWDLYSLCICYISIFTTIHKNTSEYVKHYQSKFDFSLSTTNLFTLYKTPFYKNINNLFFDILQPKYQINNYKKEFIIINSKIQEYICQGL